MITVIAADVSYKDILPFFRDVNQLIQDMQTGKAISNAYDTLQSDSSNYAFGNPKINAWGDMYASEVKKNMQRIDNPLCSYLCISSGEEALPSPLRQYRYYPMKNYHSALVNYTRLAIPKQKVSRVKRLLKEHEISLVCIDNADFTLACLRDMKTISQQDQSDGSS